MIGKGTLNFASCIAWISRSLRRLPQMVLKSKSFLDHMRNPGRWRHTVRALTSATSETSSHASLNFGKLWLIRQRCLLGVCTDILALSLNAENTSNQMCEIGGIWVYSPREGGLDLIARLKLRCRIFANILMISPDVLISQSIGTNYNPVMTMTSLLTVRSIISILRAVSWTMLFASY